MDNCHLHEKLAGAIVILADRMALAETGTNTFDGPMLLHKAPPECLHRTHTDDDTP
jgi:hypothetical protein